MEKLDRLVGKEEWKISCGELGVYECDFTAQGESPAQVVEQIADHLRSEHGVHLPEVDDILKGRNLTDLVVEGELDEDANLVVRRLREKLNIGAG